MRLPLSHLRQGAGLGQTSFLEVLAFRGEDKASAGSTCRFRPMLLWPRWGRSRVTSGCVMHRGPRRADSGLGSRPSAATFQPCGLRTPPWFLHT